MALVYFTLLIEMQYCYYNAQEVLIHCKQKIFYNLLNTYSIENNCDTHKG